MFSKVSNQSDIRAEIWAETTPVSARVFGNGDKSQDKCMGLWESQRAEWNNRTFGAPSTGKRCGDFSFVRLPEP